MAGSLQPRVKTWSATEDVTAADLNAEFDNLLTAMQPLLIDDYSTNVAQMQVTADPGEVGTESLATTMAGELARIRNMIKEISGETYWYTSPDASIATIADALGTSLEDNRIASGRVKSTSQFPLFLKAEGGAARNVAVVASVTPLVYYINGTQYTIAANVTATTLTAAPSTNNTCTVNDSNAADQEWTKFAGEDGTHLPITSVGSEITALVGKLAAFSLNNGSTTEYFIAYVETDRLTKIKRGYFFDSSEAPVPRIVYTHGDTITLLKLTWIFAKTDGTITATYNPPTWSKDEPSSPASNDYWFDLANQTWKRYNISSFESADATLIGVCAQNTSATICSRSFEISQGWNSLNTIELLYDTATQVKSRFLGSQISVWGEIIKNDHGLTAWDITADRETGVNEAASTMYYAYITETGDKIISNNRPHDRREDLQGYYHPSESWRCVGWFYNDGSSNISNRTVGSYYTRQETKHFANSITANTTVEVINRMFPVNTAAGNLNIYLPPAAYWKGQTFTYVKTSSDFNIANIRANGNEAAFSNNATMTNVCTHLESVDLSSDGANVYVTKRYIPSNWTNAGAIVLNSTGTVPTKGSNLGRDVTWWRRLSDEVQIRHEYIQFGTTGAVNGTGDTLFTPPAGIVYDLTKVYSGQNGNTGAAAQDWPATLGTATIGHPTAIGGMGTVRAYNSSSVRLFVNQTTAAGNYSPMGGTATWWLLAGNANGITISADYHVPVIGWTT